MIEQIQELICQEIQRSLVDDGISDTGDKTPVTDVAMARQPIFDADGNIWGYDLLYRTLSNTECADIKSDAVATSRIIAGGYKSARQGLRPSQKLCIKFPASMIEAQAIKLLPNEQCILSILKSVRPTPGVMDALGAVKDEGYKLALEGYTGQDDLAPFLPLVEFVKIDVPGCGAERLPVAFDKAHENGRVVVAEKVEDFKARGQCLELGCSLFQGFFFSKPEVLHHKAPGSSQVERMHIFSLLSQKPINVEALSAAILHMPLLTAGLLTFVNSAHFAFNKQVKDVLTALHLMGNVTFTQWLCVNVLGTLDGGPAAFELSFLASQRAKFLESLGETARARSRLPSGIDPQELFLTGLFSLLESILKIPLATLLDGLPLNPGVLDALLGKQSPYSPWLDMLVHYQRGEWDEAIELAERSGLTEADLAAAWAGALGWSSDFFFAGNRCP
ncbi:MAG: HDOD domain-containing protein [Desulfovibrio sp.]|jgi:EAL and modified HD-GYP domain-containing signal transduction protein|nr:HDOD domain-containing protein [Desulfovibrio sp.]